ncbi:RICIN domain-containing protein [Streptomyces sp. NPDC005480]|uniref:ricin-type beta-trefoil lectin domain protein n=1 Tax=Streptomyces sp. NPDC005480 TaxID=3154880 RepID=UPI0033A78ED2
MPEAGDLSFEAIQWPGNPVVIPGGRALHAVGAGRCLGDSNSSVTGGARQQIWDCSGRPNQTWTLNVDGTVVGVQSGLCPDVTKGATANNTPVELWTCNGRSNQQWSCGVTVSNKSC